MAMFCPQCGTSFEQRLQCPACGVRLLSLASSRSRGLFAPGWQHTPGGRVFVGLLLSQGLFYGLRHFLTGVLIVTVGNDRLPEVLASPQGLIAVQVLQAVALLLGGALAGAVQRTGLILGLILGVLNGAVAVVAQQWPATAAHSFIPIYGLPAIHGAVGAIGGWLGCTIWRPLSAGLDSGQTKRLGPKPPNVSIFAGKIHWFRILLG